MSTIMRLNLFITLTVSLGCLVPLNSAARILAIIPFRVESHFPMFEILLKGLASRGHNVVVVSHYPQKQRVENYTDISILGSIPSIKDNISLSFVDNMNKGLFALHFIDFARSSCEAAYTHPNVKKLFDMKDKFDLVINEVWANDCFLGLSSIYNTPHIGVITSVAYPWSNDRIGNPDNPSYIPNYFLPYSDKMTFLQRCVNFIYTVGGKWLHYFLSELPTHKLASEYFGKDLPPLSEIAKNTSLLLVNSHFSVNYPRPAVPAFVEVAGLHIKDAKKLPQEIKKYIDESEFGVIYFSFGTLVRPDTMPADRMKIFLEVFSEIPQRILWKCHQEKMPELPKNVRCYSWLPQRDILEHPNVRVFITHGGMMGTQEAIYTGVPMLGFPLYADQILNIENYATKGIAMKLDISTFTKEELKTSLHKLVNEEKYRKNSKHISELFRDRPLSALKTAIYWTEYVIRHRGAPHLKSQAVELTWYQYLLLDVIAVLLAFVAAFSFCVYLVLKYLLILFRSSISRPPKSKTH